MRTCLCGKRLKQNQTKYCSTDHAFMYRNDLFISSWLAGTLEMFKTYNGPHNQLSLPIQRYLYNLKGRKCWKCDWAEVNPRTGKVPVQFNHIDGDSQNNHPLNLELLCPNCHSLTPTFGVHGKGRNKRYACVA